MCDCKNRQYGDEKYLIVGLSLHNIHVIDFATAF